MAAKPAYKRIIGQQIVAVEQRWHPAEPCRGGGWGVDALVLADGSRIVLEVHEHADDYSVRLVRCPKEEC